MVVKECLFSKWGVVFEDIIHYSTMCAIYGAIYMHYYLRLQCNIYVPLFNGSIKYFHYLTLVRGALTRGAYMLPHSPHSHWLHDAEIGSGFYMDNNHWRLIDGELGELQPLLIWSTVDPPEAHILVTRTGWWRFFSFIHSLVQAHDLGVKPSFKKRKKTPIKSGALLDEICRPMIRCQLLVTVNKGGSSLGKYFVDGGVYVSLLVD